MNLEVLRKYADPVPRYTSYPTAPNFSADVDATTYATWLSALPAGEPLSLYVHIPFCDTLCWYCGCTTKMIRRYDPVSAYLDALRLETETVGHLVGRGNGASHIHWGGGSPNILKPSDILRLADILRDCFDWESDAEFAVEVDPRTMDEARIEAFGKAGVTRVSVGVQDFNPTVQVAINRQQTFEQTQRVIDLFRDAGVRSINIDLVYGLPHQTCSSVERTTDQVLSLAPDRIAVFGYAHLPERISHQRKIDTGTLPGPIERYKQSRRIGDCIAHAGYSRIGLDHYAMPSDKLANASIKRNFQGYTSDDASVLLGLGASSIGTLPQGYIQNAVPTADYIRRINTDGLAAARGIALSDEDRARAYVINRLMCHLDFSKGALRARFGDIADVLSREADALLASDTDGFVLASADGFRVTPAGQPFIRTICARFDSYLDNAPARHSQGI